MIIELNPFKLFAKKPAAAVALPLAAAAQLPQQSKAAIAEENVMANKFIGFLEAIGKDFIKGLSYAVKYAVPVEKLVALLFPGAAPAVTELVSATSLIQNAVILVEQKYAASGVQTGTGAQKASEVLLLVEQAVTSLLAKAGVTADTGYIQSLVDAVVAILNAQQAPVVVPAAVAAV